MSPEPLSRRLLLGGAVTAGTGAAVGGMLGPEAAYAAPVAWKVFFVEHPGGTPNQTAIQTALTEAGTAGGGHVVVSRGTWNVTTAPLRIFANTRLTLTPGTVLRRTGTVSSMLRNGPNDGSDTTTGGHNGPGNIFIEGGVWDANAPTVTTPGWAMVFAHAKNITIRDVQILNVAEYHAIELNSTYNALVEGCSFIGSTPRPSAVWNQEAVSMDLAAPSLVPWGAGDNTQCRLIRVVNNYCENWPTFAGCHTGLSTSGHEEFVIAGNTVRNLDYWGVSLRNTSRAVVSGNTMVNVGGGVWIRCHDDPANPPRRSNRGVVIADNVIETTKRDEGIRIIGANGGTAGDGQIYTASITGNVVRRTAKSGIRVEWAPEVVVGDNSVHITTGPGIEAPNSTAAMISGNHVRDADREGILVTGGTDHQIAGNSLVNPCRATDAVRDAVVFAGVGKACVQGNKITSITPRPRYAIASDAASSGIFYPNNDVRDGYATGAFNLLGSGHISAPGNAT